MKKLDSITLTSIAAEKAGMSYGKYVALFGVVPNQEREIDILVAPQVCQECGRTFFGRARNMKFCSDECRKKSDNRKFGKKYRELRAEKAKNRVCAICGKPIPESRALNAKTCSEECAEKLHFMNKAVSKRKNRANKADRSYLEKRTCPICCEEFIPAVHNQKYCSKECYSYANNQRSKKNNMMKKEQRKANRNDR